MNICGRMTIMRSFYVTLILINIHTFNINYYRLTSIAYLVSSVVRYCQVHDSLHTDASHIGSLVCDSVVVGNISRRWGGRG